MKKTHQLLALLLAGACAVLSATAQDYKFKAGYPTSATLKKAFDDADYQRAVTAYRIWYLAVPVEGPVNGSRALGMQDNVIRGISAAGPRQVAFTLNSDTPYGSACLDFAGGPIVIEIPPGA